MDFSAKYRQKQIAVWVLVGLTAVLANIPREWAARLNLHTEFLLGVLGLLIVLALFFFARFSYFFLTMLLIVGANLPDRWSSGLQVDKMPLIIALGVMIFGSLLNHISRILPTGLEAKPKEVIPEGIRALMAAIPRGQERAVRTVVAMNIDLNHFDEAGRTPLMAAAAAGQTKIAEILIDAGAVVDLQSPDGLTAVAIAVQSGHMATAARLQEASLQASTPRPEPARPLEQPSRL